jgi:enoyl-CoA hydratase/carnithine racemase
MSTPSLTRTGEVFVLDLGDDENRFSPAWIAAVLDALAEVAGADGPRALVTTATGKFWSNGLDLDWLLAHPDESAGYVASVQELFARTLVLPVPTVAVLQGHCFAAGALLAAGHDTALMREDRGFFCLPEIDIHIPFAPGMSALVAARFPHRTAHEAMLTGRRYGGTDAEAAGIVARALPEAELLPAAMAWAGSQAAKAGPTMGTIKATLYAGVVDLLRQETRLALPD